MSVFIHVVPCILWLSLALTTACQSKSTTNLDMDLGPFGDSGSQEDDSDLGDTGSEEGREVLADPVFLVNRWSISDEALENEMSTLGFEICHMFNQNHGDPGDTGTMDLEMVRQDLPQIIPEDAEWAMIDIERPYYAWLEEEVGSPLWTQARDELLKVMDIARELRPNTKWTFYGIPSIRYWIVDDQGTNRSRHKADAELIAADHLEQVQRYEDLTDACDWINPSIYDPWKNDEMDDLADTVLKTAAWITAEVSLARDLAVGKPVAPSVWHRFHDSSPWKHMAIHPDEFASDQLGYALEVGVEGFFYWSADPAHLKAGVTGYLSQPEFDGCSTEEDYLEVADELHYQYSSLIVESVTDSQN